MRDAPPPAWRDTRTPVRLGISACLLGEKVRYDGDHNRDPLAVETIGRRVEWVPVCPEMEIGMRAPRPPIRLERRENQAGFRLIEPGSQTDLTERMRRWARGRLAALAKEGICGFILKRNSPSCGLRRVKAFHPDDRPAGSGRGLFAEALLRAFPRLPVEENERLWDPEARGQWVARVFACHRLRLLWRSAWRKEDLAAFHAAHELELWARSPRAWRALGALPAFPGRRSRASLRRAYEEGFLDAMARPATRGRRAAALRRGFGAIAAGLDPAARRELAAAVEAYRRGEIPFLAPAALLRHYARLAGIESLAEQTFLNPDPREAAIRGWT